MSDRFNTFFRQLVSEAELDDLCATLEQADRDAAIDLGFNNTGGLAGGVLGGICDAFDAELDAPEVAVAGGVHVSSGAAYDSQGRRIQHVASGAYTTVNVTHAGYTAIGAVGSLAAADGADIQPAVGFERWISVYAVFDRLLSDERTDGTGASVYYSEAESFRFYIKAGALAALGALPVSPDVPLEATMVLLGDFRLRNAAAVTIAFATYDRRQDWMRLTGSYTPFALTQANARGAIQNLLVHLNNHAKGIAGRHAATTIDVNTASAWVDIDGGAQAGTSNPVATLEVRLDKIVTDLIATVATRSGAHKIGAAAVAGAPIALPAGNIGDQISQLVTEFNALLAAGGALPATSVAYAGSAPTQFADTSVLNPQGLGNGVESALDEFVGALGGTGGGNAGADKIGAAAAPAPGAPGTTGLVGLAAGRLATQLTDLLAGVNSRVQRAGDTMTGNLTPAVAGGVSLGTVGLPWLNAIMRHLETRAGAAGGTAAARELYAYSYLQQIYLEKIFALGDAGVVATKPVAVIGPHGHYQPRSFEFRDHFMYKELAGLYHFYDAIVTGGGTITIPTGNLIRAVGGIVRLETTGNGQVSDLRGAPKLTLIGGSGVPRQHFAFRARRSRIAGLADYKFGIRRHGSADTWDTSDDGVSRVEFYAAGANAWRGRLISPSGTVLSAAFAGTDNADYHLFEIVVREANPAGEYWVQFAVDGVWASAITVDDALGNNGFQTSVYDFEFFARLNHTGDGANTNDLDIDCWEVFSDTFGHDS